MTDKCKLRPSVDHKVFKLKQLPGFLHGHFSKQHKETVSIFLCLSPIHQQSLTQCYNQPHQFCYNQPHTHHPTKLIVSQEICGCQHEFKDCRVLVYGQPFILDN